MARFEIGDVLLTTRMSQILDGFGDRVIARYATLGEFDREGKLIQPGHASGLAQSQPPAAVVPAGQLDLHVPLAFARPEREHPQRFFV
jgi:hypothetical protein